MENLQKLFIKILFQNIFQEESNILSIIYEAQKLGLFKIK